MAIFRYIGAVKDSETGEPLRYAHVYQEYPDGPAGGVTDASGNFEIDADVSLPVLVSHVGYAPRQIAANSFPDVIEMQPGVDLNPVVVRPEKKGLSPWWLLLLIPIFKS